MASMMEIMQHCRLCLVKEQVNVPIFEEHGDIRQIFLKITACLPVKVDREDNLPKKICDGCLYKLDLLYDFWNTSSNAEKQLLSWLSAAGLESKAKIDEDLMVTPTEIVLKEEPITDMPNDIPNDMPPHDDLPKDQNFMKQQSPFETVDFAFGDTNYQDTPETITTTELAPSEGEPEAKRPRRAAAASAAAITAADLANSESEEDVDDPADQTVAKTEDESEEDEDEEIDDDLDMAEVEPAFVDVSQEANPDAQPGPSGIGKTGDAQYEYGCQENNETRTFLECEICHKKIATKYNYNLHMKIHTNERMNKCDLRDAQNARKSHILGHEDSEDSVLHVCHLCTKEFKSPESFKLHEAVCPKYQKPQPKVRGSKKPKPFKCDICSRAFIQFGSLKIHLMTHDPLCVKDERRFACDFCDQKFASYAALAKHIQKHEGIVSSEVVSCEVCGKPFASRRSLARHKRIHQDLPLYLCKICPRKFQMKKSFIKHKKEHAKESL